MNLKARAVELGKAQRAIAEDLGVSDATISAWLHRQRPVPSAFVARLALILDVDPVELLPREGERV